MIYYIEPDGKTVTIYASAPDDRHLDPSRWFHAHPDENGFITKSDLGRYVYTSPYQDENGEHEIICF